MWLPLDGGPFFLEVFLWNLKYLYVIFFEFRNMGFKSIMKWGKYHIELFLE
jgi:hypothetical protein